MTNRIAKVFSDVLRIDPELVTDETSPDNTPQWDSVAAMTLVVAIEDEFDLRLTTAEIVSMRNVAIVRKVLRGKGVADA